MADRAVSYTDATVELVAAAIATSRQDVAVFTDDTFAGAQWEGLRDQYRGDARAALDALAHAGLLLLGQAARRGFEYASEHDFQSGFERWETGTNRSLAEMRVASWAPRDVPSRVVCREVFVGPWARCDATRSG